MTILNSTFKSDQVTRKSSQTQNLANAAQKEKNKTKINCHVQKSTGSNKVQVSIHSIATKVFI